MNTCSQIHPSIAYNTDECPFCVVFEELASETETLERITNRLDELEKDIRERVEKELEEEVALLKQSRTIQSKTDLLVGCFEAPFAGEYKQPKLEKGEI